MSDYEKHTVTKESWIVQKYGGTSVGKLLETIVGEIVPYATSLYRARISPEIYYFSSYIPQGRLAIVCSARSGSTKSTGTTALVCFCFAICRRQVH
jgi:aspartate kinase